MRAEKTQHENIGDKSTKFCDGKKKLFTSFNKCEPVAGVHVVYDKTHLCLKNAFGFKVNKQTS